MPNDVLDSCDKVCVLPVPTEILNKYKSEVPSSKNLSEVLCNLFDDSDLTDSDEDLKSDSVWIMEAEPLKKVRTIDHYFKSKDKSTRKESKSSEKKRKSSGSPCEASELHGSSPALSQDIFNKSPKVSKRNATKSSELAEDSEQDYIPCSQAVMQNKLTTSQLLSQRSNKSFDKNLNNSDSDDELNVNLSKDDTSGSEDSEMKQSDGITNFQLSKLSKLNTSDSGRDNKNVRNLNISNNSNKSNQSINTSDCDTRLVKTKISNSVSKPKNKLDSSLSDKIKLAPDKSPKIKKRSDFNLNNENKKYKNTSDSGLKVSTSSSDSDEKIKHNSKTVKVSSSNLMLSKLSNSESDSDNVKTSLNMNLQKRVSKDGFKVKTLTEHIYGSDETVQQNKTVSSSMKKQDSSSSESESGTSEMKVTQLSSPEGRQELKETSRYDSDGEKERSVGKCGSLESPSQSDRSGSRKSILERISPGETESKCSEKRESFNRSRKEENVREESKKRKRLSATEESDLSSGEISFRTKDLDKLLNLSTDTNRNCWSLVVNSSPKRIKLQPERPHETPPTVESDESDSSDARVPNESLFIPKAVSSFCAGSTPVGKSEPLGEVLTRKNAARGTRNHSLSESDGSDSPEAAQPIEAEDVSAKSVPVSSKLIEDIQEQPWFRSLGHKMRRQTIDLEKKGPFLFTEDLSSEDELYTIQCPNEVSVESLTGRTLQLSRDSCLTVKSTEGDKLQVGVVPLPSTTSVNILLPSRDSKWHLRSRKVKGCLLVHKESGAPNPEETFEPRREESDSEAEAVGTPLPAGLKLRHPLHGTVEEYLTEINGGIKKRKKKLESASECQRIEKSYLSEQVQEYLVEDDGGIKKKKKKKKLESASGCQRMEEADTVEQVKEYLSDDDKEDKRKKKKKKKLESTSPSVYQSVHSDSTTQVNEYLTEDDMGDKKKKKKKKHELTSPSEYQNLHNDSTMQVKEYLTEDDMGDKKKKQKKLESTSPSVYQSVHSDTTTQVKEYLIQDDMGDKKKKKKKKHELTSPSEYQSVHNDSITQVNEYLTEDDMGDKKKKKKKLELASPSEYQSVESDAARQVKEYMTEDDTEDKKKKKKKKLESASPSEYQSVESDAARKFREHFSEDGASFKKKKKKKHKSDSDRDTDVSEKNVRGIFIGENTISLASDDEKKLKKKKKREDVSQEVADLLAQMEKKINKKKKHKDKNK